MTVKYSDNKLWSIRHYTERYAQSASARQPLVLLSGWSCDSHIFEWLIPGLAQHFVIVSAELNTIPDDISFDSTSSGCTLFPPTLIAPESLPRK